jgi:hypothetical protein
MGEPISASWLRAVCASGHSKAQPVDTDGRGSGIDEAKILGAAGAGQYDAPLPAP